MKGKTANRIHTDVSHAAKKQRRLAAGDAQALVDINLHWLDGEVDYESIPKEAFSGIFL
jgi:hypothetical protein